MPIEIDQIGRKAYQLAFRLTGNSCDAQEVLRQTLSSPPVRCSATPAETWLLRAVTESCLTRLKQGHIHPGTPQTDHGHVHTALSRMAVEDRAILVLKDIVGCSYQMIGSIMSLSIEAVGKRLHLARCTLTAILKDLTPA